jgi:hypothetical protein
MGLTTRSEDIGRVLVLTTRERFNQARKTINKVLEWASEQDELTEGYKEEYNFPSKRAGQKNQIQNSKNTQIR